MSHVFIARSGLSLYALLLALCLAVALPAASSAVGPPDVGDAVPLAAGTESSGTFSVYVTTDVAVSNHVRSFELDAGEEVSVVATPQPKPDDVEADVDVDLLIFGPGTASIYAAHPVAQSTFSEWWPGDAEMPLCYPEQVTFIASVEGTYYLDVLCKAKGTGPGDATMDVSWAIWDAEGSDSVPGDAIAASPVTGTLDWVFHPDHFYTLPSVGNATQIQIEASSTDIMDLDLAVWDPLDHVDGDFTNSYDYDSEPGSRPSIVVNSEDYLPQPMWLQAHATEGGGTYSLDVRVRHQVYVSIWPMGPVMIKYGETGRLWGDVYDRVAGAPVGAQVPIEIYTSTDGDHYSLAVTTTTDALGKFRWSLKPEVATGYYASTSDDPVVGYDDSIVEWIVPKAFVGTPSAPASVRHGAKFTISGDLKPQHKAGTYVAYVYRYRLVKGKYRSYGAPIRAKGKNHGSHTNYSASISLPYAGKWRVRVYHEDSGHAPTWSGYRSVIAK